MKTKLVLVLTFVLCFSVSSNVLAKKKSKTHKKIVSTEHDSEVIVIVEPSSQKGKGHSKKPFGQKKKFQKGPPDHAPAWGYRRKHKSKKMWHFPGTDTYYREEDKQYIYLEMGKWKIGRELPDWVNINYDNSIVIKNVDSKLKKILDQLGIK